MRIFRFMSASRGVRTLTEKRLEASNPMSLNDPFELSPTIDVSKFDREKFRQIALKEGMIREAYKRKPLVGESYPDFKARHLRNLDPFLDERMRDAEQNLMRTATNFKRMASEHWRLVCFSRNVHSGLLWSHYARSHTGVALEFDTNDTFISQVPAEDVVNVLYSIRRPEFEPCFDDESAFRAAFQNICGSKHIDWAYEEEVRLILAVSALQNDHMPFVDNPVRAVYLGACASEETDAEISRALKSSALHSTRLFRCALHEKEYGITVKACNLTC
jgi:hypothetical protein